MAVFRVKLGSSDGELAIREAHGHSGSEIREQLTREGYFVFSVRRRLDWGSWIGFKRAIPPKTFITFNKELRGLVRAGLPIAEGFDIVLERMKRGPLRTMLEDVRDKLHAGRSLSQAFADHTERIPRYYPALLHAGESSGNIVEVLDRFISQEGRIRNARKRFLQAMTYPVILMVAGLIAMFIILTRAMPQFASFYSGAQRELPTLTRVVIAISDWATLWFAWVLAGAFAALIAGHLFLQTDRGRLLGERLLRRVPLIGRLWYLSTRNIFAHTMRLLTGGGIPVPEALQITADALPSRRFASELHAAHAALLEGDSLHGALDGHTSFDGDVAEMVRIGEATGNLGEMFAYIAESGEEQAEDTLALLSSLVAPLMLLFVGLLIAFLVVAMYLPMFGSYDAVLE